MNVLSRALFLELFLSSYKHNLTIINFFYFFTYSKKETSSDIFYINITTCSSVVIFFALVHQILTIPQT